MISNLVAAILELKNLSTVAATQCETMEASSEYPYVVVDTSKCPFPTKPEARSTLLIDGSSPGAGSTGLRLRTMLVGYA
jgi:hypothetical protein